MEDVKDSDIDDWIEEDEEDASTALAKPQELEEENEKHQSRGPGQPQEEEKEIPAAEDLPTSPPSPPAEEVKEPAQEGSLVHATRGSADGMGEIVPQHISMDKSSDLPAPPQNTGDTWYADDDENEAEGGGWGSWGNFGQAVTAASFGLGTTLSQVAKQAANDLTDMSQTLKEAVKEVAREDERIGEGRGDDARTSVAEGIEADGFEARRAKFLDDVEDKTSRDVAADLQVEETLSTFAAGAASFFGTVLGSVGTAVEGSLENAQKLASTAAGVAQETLQQGVSDVNELAKASGALRAGKTGLKLAADHTVKLAEMSLEKAGTTAKGILDMADAVTGMDSRPGASAAEDEEELTFPKSFFIYGGPDAVDECEALGAEARAKCQQFKSALEGEPRREYEDCLRRVGECLDLSLPEPSGDEARPVAAFAEVAARAEACKNEVADFVNSQMSVADTGVDAQLRVVRNEAVQQLAEHTACCVRHLASLSHGLADPKESEHEDLDWPGDPLAVAGVVRATVVEVAKGLESLASAFRDEAGKFSKGNEALTGPAEALTAALAEAKEAAMDRVHEVLRAQVFVIVASHYGASAPDA